MRPHGCELAAGRQVPEVHEAVETARRSQPHLDYRATVDEAVQGADAIVVLTEWRQFRELDPVAVGQVTAARVIIDGRNCLDPGAWREAGFTYVGLGRP